MNAMDERTWHQVDDYVTQTLIPTDPGADALAASARHGLPSINVTAPQGKFLGLLASAIGARSVLEIGTLGGYSTVWLATALPDGGRVVTLEADPRNAEVAAANLQAAGVRDRVRVVVGPALDSLPQLEADGSGPFDLVFIDADKVNNATYVGWAVRLGRPGTVIILDNVVRDGNVVDAGSTDPSVVGTRAAFDVFADHPRLDATALQTVGAKGYDGFAMAVVRAG